MCTFRHGRFTLPRYRLTASVDVVPVVEIFTTRAAAQQQQQGKAVGPLPVHVNAGFRMRVCFIFWILLYDNPHLS